VEQSLLPPKKLYYPFKEQLFMFFFPMKSTNLILKVVSFFFDRSPKYFEEILNYLRTNSMDWVNFQTSTSQIAVSKELDFYGFQSMIHESSISEDAYKIFNNISKQLSDNKNNLHFNQLMKFEQNVLNIYKRI
jgi:hypothetical protein